MLDEDQDNNTQNWLPSWVHRASNDEWNFGIILKNGLKVGFGSIASLDCLTEPKDVWIHLNSTDMDPHVPDGCIQLNGRGMRVRLSEVAAFWERCTT
jgi:hypothetical protein